MNEQRNDDYSAEMHGLYGRSEEEGAENLASGGASNLLGTGNETFRLRRMLETRFRDRPLIGSLNYATQPLRLHPCKAVCAPRMRPAAGDDARVWNRRMTCQGCRLCTHRSLGERN